MASAHTTVPGSSPAALHAPSAKPMQSAATRAGRTRDGERGRSASVGRGSSPVDTRTTTPTGARRRGGGGDGRRRQWRARPRPQRWRWWWRRRGGVRAHRILSLILLACTARARQARKHGRQDWRGLLHAHGRAACPCVRARTFCTEKVKVVPKPQAHFSPLFFAPAFPIKHSKM